MMPPATLARTKRTTRSGGPCLAARIAAIAVVILIGIWPWSRAECRGNVAATVHNLSPSGPGKQKDTRVAGVCAYCHTPHNVVPSRALWNRPTSGVTYQLYTSTSMQATVDQPTGSSRLCLSCHDGVLALASAQLAGAGNGTSASATPMTGPTVLGTDLRTSHPFSFTYDSALAAKRGELADPAALPAAVRLDAQGQLQCTSCHDPHEDKLPKFMRMDNGQGALCMTCHRLDSWNISSHATSTASWTGAGPNPFPAGGKPSVAANACNNCHRSHAAAHGGRLLARAVEIENCTVCHAGTVARKNIAAEFSGAAKASRHPIDAAPWTHASKENPASMPRHVTCADCHNAHQARAMVPGETGLTGPLRGVTGMTESGAPTPAPGHEYEVCFKCHGDSSTTGAIRVDRSRNIRERLSAANASYHPVVAAARTGSARGLMAGYTASSTIGCIDCHNNSDPAPRGPHASRYAPILERSYAATDPSVESPSSYALCYKCHDRTSIVTPSTTAGASYPAGSPPATPAATARTAAAARLPAASPRIAAVASSGFPHWLHVVKNQTSCAVCHDAHGSRSNAHLIDFMSRDATGRPVVTANQMGRLEYIGTGPRQGTCYLSCHGRDHGPLSY